MRIFVARNATSEVDSIAVFRKRGDAIKWLEAKGLKSITPFFIPKGSGKTDMTEFDYWIDEVNLQ